MFCPVFCTPSARPAQNGPASSAVAVKPRPLSVTVTTRAATAAATDSHVDPPTPHSTIVTIATTATTRIGPIRLPTRSDHTPTAIRPAAPTTRTTATSRPAPRGAQPTAA